MENDIKQYIKQQNEDLFNNKFDIKNINELNQNENIYNLNIKEKNPENLSIFDKYKLQNLDSINNETKEDNDIKIKDKISKCKGNSFEQDLKIKNDNYTNQINEIISKNFKNGLDSSQNIYFNTYLNNEKKNKFLELDRERKLLLLKNIELEKEINNLNNFVDIGNKLPQNKILNNNRLNKKMEDIKSFKKNQNEDILNNRNDINNYNKENILNFDKKEKNSEYMSIFDKYKFQNVESSNNDIKENNDISIKNKKDNNPEILEQELIKKNNNYTNQINEIISKNFKHGLDMSPNLYVNSYLNNSSTNKYLELDRERKLLLLKNIELEKEINNLNNFVDIGSKFNQNKVLNYNRSKKNNIESYNNKMKNSNNMKDEIVLKKEIKDAQNMIKLLDKRINKLKQEINMNYSMSNNKYNEKIKEVKIWRETFYEEFFKYKNLLKDLKENLNKDKIIYNDVILKMKQKSAENINTIYENYKNQIIENEKKLIFLKSENEKLTKKENKVKEIFLYNFK